MKILIISDVTLDHPDLPEDEETMKVAAESDIVISLCLDAQGHQQGTFIKSPAGRNENEIVVVDLA